MKIYYTDATGEIVRVEDTGEPDVAAEQELARQSAVAKLQALGLTEAEALALVGGTP
jgi:hypothetical protein